MASEGAVFEVKLNYIKSIKPEGFYDMGEGTLKKKKRKKETEFGSQRQEYQKGPYKTERIRTLSIW